MDGRLISLAQRVSTWMQETGIPLPSILYNAGMFFLASLFFLTVVNVLYGSLPLWWTVAIDLVLVLLWSLEVRGVWKAIRFYRATWDRMDEPVIIDMYMRLASLEVVVHPVGRVWSLLWGVVVAVAFAFEPEPVMFGNVLLFLSNSLYLYLACTLPRPPRARPAIKEAYV